MYIGAPPLVWNTHHRGHMWSCHNTPSFFFFKFCFIHWKFICFAQVTRCSRTAIPWSWSITSCGSSRARWVGPSSCWIAVKTWVWTERHWGCLCAVCVPQGWWDRAGRLQPFCWGGWWGHRGGCRARLRHRPRPPTGGVPCLRHPQGLPGLPQGLHEEVHWHCLCCGNLDLVRIPFVSTQGFCKGYYWKWPVHWMSTRVLYIQLTITKNQINLWQVLLIFLIHWCRNYSWRN